MSTAQKDAFLQGLAVGDKVAYVGSSGYRGSRGSLGLAWVHSFTPKGIRLVHSRAETSQPFVRFPGDVVRLRTAQEQAEVLP